LGGAVLATVGLAACGSSSSGPSSATELQIDRERSEAAQSAHQEDKLKALEGEVHRLKRHKRVTQVNKPGTAAEDTPATSVATNGEVRLFHAPGGNVNCEVQADSARCTVVSTAQTFVLPAGDEAAYVESGAALPTDSGALTGFGSTVSIGAISCEVPYEDEPRGVVCQDNDTGHGFQASKDYSRQQVF
jgi:hypothetical protein